MTLSRAGLWFATLALIAAPRDPLAPGDPRVPELAREVKAKGWIVFEAKTDKGDWDLFLMRPDGSARRNITNAPDTNELGGRFSPDGKRILYRRVAREGKIPHDKWGALGQLVIANANGSNPVTWGETGEFPWASWSPDGLQVGCLTKTGIEIRDLATKQVVRKIDRKGIYQQLFWSPDGKWFTGPANTYGENWTVIRLNAFTGDVNPVNKFQNCTADWSPDSRRVIFSSRPADQGDEAGLGKAVGQKPEYGWTQLMIAGGDGGNRMLIYGEDGKHIYGGALSPDSKYVLFTRSSRDGGRDDGFINVMRLRDAPTIGGASVTLRKKYPQAKDGPILPLTLGWEPHWTYALIPEGKGK